MNSYIMTKTGMSILIKGSAYTVDQTHPNYARVKDLVRERKYELIPDALNVQKAIERSFEFKGSELSVVDNQVAFRREKVPAVIQTAALDTFKAGFSLQTLDLFLKRLYANPSKKAVDELYGWISANGITISEDGFLYAYKRVNTNFTSMFDDKTLNHVGTYVQMSRNEVDDRSDNTCAPGLHFCSQSYLPHYGGGRGQVLLLKIDPADVVSIPTDYNQAKGRACKYFVEAALSGDARGRVETDDVLKQTVIRKGKDVNESNAFKAAYKLGYKDGRGKQKKFKSFQGSRTRPGSQEMNGYTSGFIDGKQKKPKRFV